MGLKGLTGDDCAGGAEPNMRSAACERSEYDYSSILRTRLIASAEAARAGALGGPINDDDSAARSGEADGPLRMGELAESSVGVGVRDGGGREGTMNGLDVGAETDRIVGAVRGCIVAGLGSRDDGPGPATGR